MPTTVQASANFRMRSVSSAVKRRRVGVATTSGFGGTLTAGRGEAVPRRRPPGSFESSTGVLLVSIHEGCSSPPATLIEERQRVPLILAQRADGKTLEEVYCDNLTARLTAA